MINNSVYQESVSLRVIARKRESPRVPACFGRFLVNQAHLRATYFKTQTRNPTKNKSRKVTSVLVVNKELLRHRPAYCERLFFSFVHVWKVLLITPLSERQVSETTLK